jgi:hypothetical protein
MPITLDGTNGITTPMYNGSITANAVTPSVNIKNRIINGAMVIDQRNAGASVTPASGDYTLDRFQAFSSAASKYSVQQNAGSVTPPVGFKNYLGVTSLAATSVGSGDYYMIEHKVEGLNCYDLAWGTANAKTVTLSFQVYSSLTGTFGGSILNNASNRSYPFTYTISTANTWTSISVTIAGDTSGTWLTTNGTGLYISFSLGMGSTYSGTAGAWAGSQYWSATGATSVVGTNGATFYITGVQLEVGSTATSFDYRPYGTELALCQRYFQTYGYGNGQEAVLGTGMFYTSTELLIVAEFKVIMRAIPTYSCTTVTNGFRYSRAGATTNINTLPYLGSRSTSSATFGNVSLAVGGTAGYASSAIAELDGAKINFSAEL